MTDVVNAVLHEGNFVALEGRVSIKQLRAALKGIDSNKDVVFTLPDDNEATTFDADGNAIHTFSIVSFI